MMKHFTYFCVLTTVLLTLTACIPQATEEITVTPPVVAAVEEEEEATETAVPPTATAEATPIAEATAVVVEPEQPTPEPTAPPATATAEPTAIPATAVNQVNLQWVADGFTKPLGVTHAGDDRLFVIEQNGRIKILHEGNATAETFLNLESVVNSGGNEQGLLGLAFHPDYQNNGRFFLNYTHANGSTVIAEYLVSADNPNQADATSERVLMMIGQPFSNHNGGQIAFGADGYLYIGMGDGGSQNDPQNVAQDKSSLLGAILRIDVDNGDPYGIPQDNPYVGDDNGRNEIWSIGWRNPWRISFDRLTGDMFIADVGQNEWEEISYEAAGSLGGQNYGWRIFEGDACYLDDCSTPNLTPPIAQYNHNEGHCSVTGGYMYRGSDHPALYGNYFFADYCSGAMWRIFPNSAGTWDMAEVARTGFLVSSFGEDAQGEVYVVDQIGGSVYKLTP